VGGALALLRLLLQRDEDFPELRIANRILSLYRFGTSHFLNKKCRARTRVWLWFSGCNESLSTDLMCIRKSVSMPEEEDSRSSLYVRVCDMIDRLTEEPRPSYPDIRNALIQIRNEIVNLEVDKEQAEEKVAALEGQINALRTERDQLAEVNQAQTGKLNSMHETHRAELEGLASAHRKNMESKNEELRAANDDLEAALKGAREEKKAANEMNRLRDSAPKEQEDQDGEDLTEVLERILSLLSGPSNPRPTSLKEVRMICNITETGADDLLSDLCETGHANRFGEGWIRTQKGNRYAHVCEVLKRPDAAKAYEDAVILTFAIKGHQRLGNIWQFSKLGSVELAKVILERLKRNGIVELCESPFLVEDGPTEGDWYLTFEGVDRLGRLQKGAA
jgi:hypothetical protein